jgi:hypothetical protein
MAGKEIQLSCGRIWLDDNDIMRLVYDPGIEITLRESKEVGAALQELSQGRKKPLLVDARTLKNISREARVYWESEEITQTISATATLSSPIVKVLGSLYTSLNKPPFEIKYFSTETEALKWLKTLREA